MEEKKTSLKMLLNSTIMDISLDGRMVLSQLSKKLMTHYTMISLIDEIFKHVQESSLDHFIFNLIRDRELGENETIPNSHMTQVNTFYEIVIIFWIRVFEVSSREHVLEAIKVVLDSWKQTLKIRKMTDHDEAIAFLVDSLPDDILFIITVCLYNMHVAMILTREELKRENAENNLN